MLRSAVSGLSGVSAMEMNVRASSASVNRSSTLVRLISARVIWRVFAFLKEVVAQKPKARSGENKLAAYRDCGDVRVSAAHDRQELKPGHIWHTQVSDDKVRDDLPKDLQTNGPRNRESGAIQYIPLPDEKSLEWAASVGCVEIHSFLHRYPYTESPTIVAFDLDPGEGMDVIDCCGLPFRGSVVARGLWPRMLPEGIRLERRSGVCSAQYPIVIRHHAATCTRKGRGTGRSPPG